MNAPLFPVMAPASPLAAPITGLMWVTLLLGLGVFLLVTVAIFYFVRRYRHRGAQGEPPQVFGNAPEELIWMGAATLVLILIFALSVRVAAQSSPPTDEETPEITVTARQWFWQASYPGGAVSANEIHIPAGRRILLALESGDVIHDFWAYRLGRKLDVIPGQHNRLWIQASAPGVYQGACAEYCGTQHAWMRFVVVAQTPAEYQDWLTRTARPAATPTTDALAGSRLYARLGCPVCHAIGASSAQKVGPDLTHFGSRQLIAGGVLSNTPEHLTRWLNDPDAVKPGTRMPNYPLTGQDIADLTRYLEGLQ
ncbi:cytochrome c oxidase subunit II [Deinococcus altitudinis]|uniref:cytochrome c oxidase subunit II n=1 Tax=Deinococcus altitudinis TaxID=468914 RepID=UPI0038925A80